MMYNWIFTTCKLSPWKRGTWLASPRGFSGEKCMFFPRVSKYPEQLFSFFRTSRNVLDSKLLFKWNWIEVQYLLWCLMIMFILMTFLKWFIYVYFLSSLPGLFWSYANITLHLIDNGNSVVTLLSRCPSVIVATKGACLTLCLRKPPMDGKSSINIFKFLIFTRPLATYYVIHDPW